MTDGLNEGMGASQIKCLEEDLGARLPRDYLDFLSRRSTAGDPPLREVVFSVGEGVESVLQQVLSLMPGPNSLVDIARRYFGRIPSDLCPVALDPGGNLVCLSVSGERRGGVFFWDHEFEGQTEDQCLTRLARSWQAFVDSLRPEVSEPSTRGRGGW